MVEGGQGRRVRRLRLISTLYGYGRLPWERARELLGGCRCTWTDLDGIHLTAAPPGTQPVGATHLWGWTTGRCVRLRFDTDAAYPAVLRDGPEPPEPSPEPEAVLTEPVTPARRPAVIWAPEDRQTGPLPQAVLDLTWELIEVPGTSPVTFVRAVGS